MEQGETTVSAMQPVQPTWGNPSPESVVGRATVTVSPPSPLALSTGKTDLVVGESAVVSITSPYPAVPAFDEFRVKWINLQPRLLRRHAAQVLVRAQLVVPATEVSKEGIEHGAAAHAASANNPPFNVPKKRSTRPFIQGQCKSMR